MVTGRRRAALVGSAGARSEQVAAGAGLGRREGKEWAQKENMKNL